MVEGNGNEDNFLKDKWREFVWEFGIEKKNFLYGVLEIFCMETLNSLRIMKYLEKIEPNKES